jgi:hypothetical protein
MRVLTDEQEAEIVRRYATGEGSYKIAKDYPVAYSSIKRVLKRRKVKLRPVHESHRKYNCDFNYFHVIDTEPKAYWLGFFAADGHVRPVNNTAAIVLSRKDTDHLERFKAAINATHPINLYVNRSPLAGESEVCRLAIQSADMVSDLISHGVIPRKSGILQWPLLRDDLYRHYLRGYMDGNGGFSWSGTGRYGFNWSLCSGPDFLKDAQSFLVKSLNFTKTKIAPKSETIVVRSLRYKGYNQMRALYDLLYSDATIWLPRKRDKADGYFAAFQPATKGPRGIKARERVT